MCFKDDELLSYKKGLDSHKKEKRQDLELALCKTDLASCEYIIERFFQPVGPPPKVSNDFPEGELIQKYLDNVYELHKLKISKLTLDLQMCLLMYTHYLYDHTHNPLFAWDAFKICQHLGWSAPDWVNEYLKESSFALLNIVDEGSQGKRSVDLIPRALGLSGGQGTRSMFTQYANAHKRLTIYFMVKNVGQELKRKERSRLPGMDKFTIVGDILSVSSDHVKTIFYDEKKAIESLGAKM